MADISVFGVYGTRPELEAAVEEMRRDEFRNEDISILFPHNEDADILPDAAVENVPEGAAAGAASGAVIGGALGWFVGIGSIAVPGVGAFVAAGPLLGFLTGAGVGATVGGVAGALIGLGMPKHEAKRYEGLVEAGRMLVSIRVEDTEGAEKARALFRRTGATEVSSTAELAREGRVTA